MKSSTTERSDLRRAGFLIAKTVYLECVRRHAPGELREQGNSHPVGQSALGSYRMTSEHSFAIYLLSADYVLLCN